MDLRKQSLVVLLLAFLVSSPTWGATTISAGGHAPSHAVIAANGDLLSPAPEPWCDSFEDYSGSGWSVNWHGSGNVPGIEIDHTYAHTGSASLRMFGLLGSCWGSVVTRPISMDLPLEVTFSVTNGHEPLSGCHPYRAMFGLRTGPDWWDCPCPGLLTFLPNGDIKLGPWGGATVYTGFALDTWHDVRCRLSLPGDSQLHAEFWVNSSYLGEITLPEESWMSEPAYLDISCQEGTVWFDDICVGPASEPEFLPVALDIKPGSCPNPLNLRPYRDGAPTLAVDELSDAVPSAKPDPGVRPPRGVLPVAILGTAEFDPTMIDWTTVTLQGVSPIRHSFEDVAAPVPADAVQCQCTAAGPDGYTDMTLKFYRDEIIAALGQVYAGETVALTLTGNLLDGTPIEGTDCVHIINGPEPPEPPLAADDQTPVLLGNYPNPFNPATQIGFSLPAASHVTLVVYNIMGQQVAVLADGQYEAGDHSVTWDASAQSSGVYLYLLDVSGFSQTRKMLLLK